MNVLAFDTCFSACSVAVRTREGRQECEHCAMETGHAEALIPMIERVMSRAGLAFSDLDRLIVTNGPGTFTGVRTGVAAARALALSTGAEIVAVSSLWAIGLAALEATELAPDIDGVLIAMDARKGQHYVQIVDRAANELSEPALLTAETAATVMPDMRIAVCGSGAEPVLAAARQSGRAIGMASGAGAATNLTSPHAKVLLQAARRSSMSDIVLPLYLRPPDAKPQAAKSLPWSTG